MTVDMGDIRAEATAANALAVELIGEVDFDVVNHAMRDLRGPLWRSLIGAADPALAVALGLHPGSTTNSIHVSVDMSGCDFIDSAGLGLLVRLRNNAATFRIFDPSESMQRLIDFTGLHDILGRD